MGSTIADYIADNMLPVKLIRMGVENEYIHIVRTADGMRKYYKCGREGILEVLKELYI